MFRHSIRARPDWQAKVERLGMLYHSHDTAPYWFEDAYYEFSPSEADCLHDAIAALHQLCLEAVEFAIRADRFDEFQIPRRARNLIRDSWRRRDPSLYGRFDLAFDGTGLPKMLEYNADTPTSCLESAVIQWYWLEECFPNDDQFNSLWEALVARWKATGPSLSPTIYFACADEIEDEMTVTLLQDTAIEAGLQTEFIKLGDVGWDPSLSRFVDLQNRPIESMFKLYPWEWLMAEPFRTKIRRSQVLWMEPIWKMLLSNKALLPLLWEMFPGHPNLLPAYLDGPRDLVEYVKKPILGREGANVSIHKGSVLEENGGVYGEESFVYQQYQAAPDFDGNRPVIGGWVIGNEPAGIGVRESDSLITNNLSRFVPHLLREHR